MNKKTALLYCGYQSDCDVLDSFQIPMYDSLTSISKPVCVKIAKALTANKLIECLRNDYRIDWDLSSRYHASSNGFNWTVCMLLQCVISL